MAGVGLVPCVAVDALRMWSLLVVLCLCLVGQLKQPDPAGRLPGLGTSPRAERSSVSQDRAFLLSSHTHTLSRSPHQGKTTLARLRTQYEYEGRL